MSKNAEKPEETPEPTIEDLLKDLPLKEGQKAILVKVIGGVAVSLNEINTRLDNLEKQPATENPDIYSGLSADQKYQVMMAKASGPAAAAQQNLLQSLLARTGGNTGGDFAALAKSAESIQALRSILLPAASPLQVAMEKAQVSQVLAQTRLMNKVAGKATSDYLDKLEQEIEGAGSGEGEE